MFSKYLPSSKTNTWILKSIQWRIKEEKEMND